MTTVRERKDWLHRGLVVPLHGFSGTPDYKKEPGQSIHISFYDRLEHCLAKRKCSLGCCEPNTNQIHYCEELRFKAQQRKENATGSVSSNSLIFQSSLCGSHESSVMGHS